MMLVATDEEVGLGLLCRRATHQHVCAQHVAHQKVARTPRCENSEIYIPVGV